MQKSFGKHRLPNSRVKMDDKNKQITFIETGSVDFFKSIADLIKQAINSLGRAVNTAMVSTYYEIGKRIIEKEQKGAKRAEYGKRILEELSAYLTAEIGKGYSVDNLKLMRRFYVVYSAATPIGESVIPQFHPHITWTHYLLLMRIDNPDERSFYEIEITNNGWSFREFQRQFDSSLYERLALSRNKKKVRQLATKGQIIDTPQDLFKDPYVLEFTGLPERAEYTENDN
jgi:predicted nuclease of restriction endonuclease-like (RecB) superfamily